jgi:hypothetical protein
MRWLGIHRGTDPLIGTASCFLVLSAVVFIASGCQSRDPTMCETKDLTHGMTSDVANQIEHFSAHESVMLMSAVEAGGCRAGIS